MMDELVVVDANGVEHVFPADMDPSRAAAIVRQQAKAPVASVKQQPARSITERVTEALPTVGGLVGGLVGGIPGAAAGGAAGSGFRSLIDRAGELPGAVADVASGLVNNPRETLAGFVEGAKEGATGAAKAGAVEGASEVAGLGLAKGAGMAAHGLMDFAIRPAPTVAEEFGDIAATAIKERLPVGSILPGGKRGSVKAGTALREASGETRRLLDDAAAKGVEFGSADVARGPVTEMVGEIAKRPLSQSELSEVSRLFSEYLNTQNPRMAPRAVKDMKQAAQRIARPIFRAINQGNMPAPGEALRAQFNKAIAEGSQEALETIPGVAAAEKRTQSLIGANKAIRRAESRRMPLVAELAAPITGAAVGGAVGGYEGAGQGLTATMLTRALLSPRTTSRAALALTNEQIQQVLQQMPRASVYALLEQVTGTGSAPTE